MKKIKVIVVFGGKSGEHEVSIRSAHSIISAIDKEKYEVVPVAIAKNGAWLPPAKAQVLLENGKKADRGEISFWQNQTLQEISPSRLTVVFPVLHGPYGEDGTFQGMLEMLNIPYVGAGVLGSALGMDKIVQKQVYLQHNLPVAPFFWFLKKDWQKNKNLLLKKIQDYFQGFFPLFVKPANLGSSVGISKAHNKEELIKAIDFASQFDRKILLEKSVENAWEIEISVLGNDDPQASVCGEIIPANEFYDYDAKYINENSRLVIPAPIEKKVQAKIQEYALTAFKALDLSGLARIDFFLEKNTNKIWINEVNTMPGFTSISMYPKLWEASGLSYSDLVEKLIKLAVERWREKQEIKTSI